MLTISLPQGRGADLSSNLFVRAVAWVGERIRERRSYQRTVNELSSLTDRELDDIGLRRVDIAPLARHCAYNR